MDITLEDRDYFKVVYPDQPYRGMTYNNLIKEWWNKAYSSALDYIDDMNTIFLRGNIVGDPYDVDKDKMNSNSLALIKETGNIHDQTGKGINITTNTAVFFPVYDTMFLIDDEYEGKKLKNLYECRVAARKEFKLMSAAWATCKIIEDNNKGKNMKVVQDLSKYYTESSPFTLIASDENRLNREPAYTLKGGRYKGLAVGIYLLMTDFKPMTYRIDFGGLSEKFYTRAVYDIKVVGKGEEFRINDVSEEMMSHTIG